MNENEKSGYLIVETISAKKEKNVIYEESIIPLRVVFSYDGIEEEQPGTLTIIQEELKKQYIANYVIPFFQGRNGVEKELGKFQNDIELFDRYWELKQVLCKNVTFEIK